MKYAEIIRLLGDASLRYPGETREQILTRVREKLEASGVEWTPKLAEKFNGTYISR